jgi:DNA-binding NarL/FixJ family response regulator
MNNILILEDFADTRKWLVAVVAKAFNQCVIHQAETIKQAKSLSHKPLDLALVDLNLPDGSGVDYIIWLLTHQPNCYVVVASIFDDDEHLFKALQAGASGYLLKEEGKESLVTALQGIINGQPPLSPAISRKILMQFKAPHTPFKQDSASLANTTALFPAHPQMTETKNENHSPPLTEREEQVLNLVAKGFNRNEVAQYLNISVHTAASHVKNIYRKLNVSSRAEVALEAMRLGLT